MRLAAPTAAPSTLSDSHGSYPRRAGLIYPHANRGVALAGAVIVQWLVYEPSPCAMGASRPTRTPPARQRSRGLALDGVRRAARARSWHGYPHNHTGQQCIVCETSTTRRMGESRKVAPPVRTPRSAW